MYELDDSLHPKNQFPSSLRASISKEAWVSSVYWIAVQIVRICRGTLNIGILDFGLYF